MINQNQVLHSAFNIETHKKVFINYLEIVIDAEGVCHYAVPSHNGVLEQLLLKKKGIEFDYFNYSMKAGDLCPRERYADYYDWLCEETGCIMVWGAPTSIVKGKPNEKQQAMLDLLRKEELF